MIEWLPKNGKIDEEPAPAAAATNKETIQQAGAVDGAGTGLSVEGSSNSGASRSAASMGSIKGSIAGADRGKSILAEALEKAKQSKSGPPGTGATGGKAGCP